VISALQIVLSRISYRNRGLLDGIWEDNGNRERTLGKINKEPYTGADAIR
jgi:hypothetical protein